MQHLLLVLLGLIQRRLAALIHRIVVEMILTMLLMMAMILMTIIIVIMLMEIRMMLVPVMIVSVHVTPPSRNSGCPSCHNFPAPTPPHLALPLVPVQRIHNRPQTYQSYKNDKKRRAMTLTSKTWYRKKKLSTGRKKKRKRSRSCRRQCKNSGVFLGLVARTRPTCVSRRLTDTCHPFFFSFRSLSL